MKKINSLSILLIALVSLIIIYLILYSFNLTKNNLNPYGITKDKITPLKIEINNISKCNEFESRFDKMDCLNEFRKKGLISKLNISLCNEYKNNPQLHKICYINIAAEMGECSIPNNYACDNNISKYCRCEAQNCNNNYYWINTEICKNGCNESLGKCNN